MHIQKGLQADLVFDDASLAEAACSAVTTPSLKTWAPADWPVAPDWQPVVQSFLATTSAQQLGAFVQARLDAGALIYPPEPFQALALTPRHRVKVVILGQDPYHGPGQAHGLAFSVPPGVRPAPSLRNIFKEIARDAALQPHRESQPADACLRRWAEQGVLLLNTCLTVEAGQPASHARRGWEALTDALIAAVAASPQPVVFMLWGAHAQARAAQILAADPAPARHLILRANHPSPLSALRPPAPFLGCGHFSAANAFLQQHQCTPIRW